MSRCLIAFRARASARKLVSRGSSSWRRPSINARETLADYDDDDDDDDD